MNAFRTPMSSMLNRQSAVRHPRSAGFTLIEALVAVGLTTILLWGLLQLYTSATRFSSTVTLEAELCSAGRAVLERMTREIGSASVRDDTHSLAIANMGSQFSSIAFYAPVGDDGELVLVRYYTQDVDGKRVLMRDVEGTDASFGLTVQRFTITAIDDDGTELASGGKAFSDELPIAVNLELLLQDRDQRATIALSSSAFLPGSGL